VPRIAQHAGYNVTGQHDQDVMQMNGIWHGASARIQCQPPSLVSMIEEHGQPAADLEIASKQETTMLKKISAALLAVSILAAPALAAGSRKIADAPLIKTTQTNATQAKTTQPKASVLNANAKMGKHHRTHHRHHRHHKKMGALKTSAKTGVKASLKTGKASPKVSLKPAASTTKRG
jgi:hypothetical protein